VSKHSQLVHIMVFDMLNCIDT